VHGDQKKSFVPVSFNQQKEALDYLITNAILPQKWLFTPKIIHQVYPVRDAPDGERYYSPISMLRVYQTNIIYKLLKTDRLMRIVENEVLVEKKEKVFTQQYIFKALYSAIFKKTLKGKSLTMFDRITQKNYIDVLTVDRNKLLVKTKKKSLSQNSTKFKNIHFTYIPRVSDIGSSKRAALEKILKLFKKKKRKGDKLTQEHYNDLIARIEYDLNN
jgi:hypothetical protein